MVYDITIKQSIFETFINNFKADGTMTDIAPEGLCIPLANNHTGKNLLIVSNEVSGTTTVYNIEGQINSSTSQINLTYHCCISKSCI